MKKRWLIVLHDMVWVPVAALLAYWVWYNLGWIPGSSIIHIAVLAGIAAPLHFVAFLAAGTFRGFWRYASIADLLKFLMAIGGATFMTGLILLAVPDELRPAKVILLLFAVFLFLGVVGSRVFYRAMMEHTQERQGNRRDTALIIGAGQAGNLLIRDLLANGPYRPAAILDDDASKTGQELHGVRVMGGISRLPALVRRFGVQVVLVAMPSADKATLRNIVEACAKLGVMCRKLPSLVELAHGRVAMADLRPVTVNDLLGRDPVVLDSGAVDRFLRGKRVLVTGGGGSIGSELCQQIARMGTSQLVVLEAGEYNLYRVEQELRASGYSGKLSLRLGDCRDERVVDRIFAEARADIVFHAAAYKHVPLVEENVLEGCANNILGTRTVADAAIRHRVRTFVLVSTDKTVNPTNYMGASKRVAEIYCQSRNREIGTHFITTRFGNVLASTGSVVPLFEAQIRNGGPVTVTHPDIARYFMTIPEAASLILQAGAMGKGGEIFVLDMGELVRIRDLAEKMIQLSGLQPGRDIKIEYTGLRAGEKLFEELFYESESLQKTGHPKLLLANSKNPDLNQVSAAIDSIALAIAENNIAGLTTDIKRLVPGFTQSAPLVAQSPSIRLVKS